MIVEFKILCGKKAGATWVARRFPVRVGRSPNCELRTDDEGVWDEHLRVQFEPAKGFVLEATPNALATINGQPLQRTVLRNGDLIEIGSVKMQFCLSETRQTGLRLREALTWAAIAGICLGQIGLIYWLLK